MIGSALLDALLGDEALRGREFPVCRQKTYLAHAAVCPLPHAVVEALRGYLEQVTRGGQFEFLHAKEEGGARALAAQLLGVTADEIGFVPSTSAGLNLIASGIDWRPGDSVVIQEGDFPSNVHPWRNLERLGVRVKALPKTTLTKPDGRGVTVDDVAEAMDDRTRLVALSSVHFVTGAWTDVDAVGAFLRTRGVLFSVDAIQSFGALPLSARHVDFLTADAHKWMLGPQGMGILFVRRERFSELSPSSLGWKSAADTKDFSSPRLVLPDSARRYEPGSLNALGVVGLHAALSLLAEAGIDAIAARLGTLRARLAEGLAVRGYSILGHHAPQHPSGIISFRNGSDDETTALYKRLDGKAIVTSLRDDPDGNKCIRVAPHFYTSDREIETLFQNL